MRYVIPALVVMTGISLAPQASATPEGFVAAMRSAGITGTDAEILTVGRAVCRMIGNTSKPDRSWVTAEVWLEQNASLTQIQAEEFVVDAALLLCPTG